MRSSGAIRVGLFVSSVVGGALATPATPPLRTRLVASGLVFPVFVTAPPGDVDRLFVVEKNSGRVRIVKNGQVLGKNFLNMWGKITQGGERGLLGLAFHPNYAQNGWFYVHYVGMNDAVVVERYTVSAQTPNLADGNSGVVLFTEPQPFAQHKAGMLQFGPDGYLYVALGDGGSGYDPFNHAQTLDTLKGKILRLDVDSGTPYAIPADNPFVAVPGARGEIWAYGLRNPFRFWIDAPSGDMFIGDVGQEAQEEIDFLPAGVGGLNFGWRCFEGSNCTGLQHCVCNPGLGTYTPPILTYGHDEGCAVMGGVVYRGCAMPALQGTYFYADHCFGRIWSLRYEGGVVVDHVERTAELDPEGDLDIGSISAIGVDGRGEMYIVDYGGGELFRIEPDLPAGPDCNSNGVPDGCDVAQGVAADSDGDGVLDSCESFLTVSPLQPASPATFHFEGAQAQETVFFLYGTGGTAPAFCLDPNLCIGLGLPFELLVALPADAAGEVGFTVSVPPTTPLGPLWFQCVLYRGATGADSILSNVVANEVCP